MAKTTTGQPRQGLLWDSNAQAWKQPGEMFRTEPEPPSNVVQLFPQKGAAKGRPGPLKSPGGYWELPGGYSVQMHSQPFITATGEGYKDKYFLSAPDGRRVGISGYDSLAAAKRARTADAKKTRAARKSPKSPPKPGSMAIKSPAIGKIVTTPVLRLRRSTYGLLITELKNAGKRGKKVRTASWYATGTTRLPREPVRYIANAKSFGDAVGYIRDWMSERNPTTRPATGAWAPIEVAGGTELQLDSKRGIDEEPPGVKRYDFATPHMVVDVQHQDFSIRDLRDKANLPVMIPPIKTGKRKAIKAMYEFVGANLKRIKKLTFLEFRRELDEHDIRYHHFLSMD